MILFYPLQMGLLFMLLFFETAILFLLLVIAAFLQLLYVLSYFLPLYVRLSLQLYYVLLLKYAFIIIPIYYSNIIQVTNYCFINEIQKTRPFSTIQNYTLFIMILLFSPFRRMWCPFQAMIRIRQVEAGKTLRRSRVWLDLINSFAKKLQALKPASSNSV